MPDKPSDHWNDLASNLGASGGEPAPAEGQQAAESGSADPAPRLPSLTAKPASPKPTAAVGDWSSLASSLGLAADEEPAGPPSETSLPAEAAPESRSDGPPATDVSAAGVPAAPAPEPPPRDEARSRPRPSGGFGAGILDASEIEPEPESGASEAAPSEAAPSETLPDSDEDAGEAEDARPERSREEVVAAFDALFNDSGEPIDPVEPTRTGPPDPGVSGFGAGIAPAEEADAPTHEGTRGEVSGAEAEPSFGDPTTASRGDRGQSEVDEARRPRRRRRRRSDGRDREAADQDALEREEGGRERAEEIDQTGAPRTRRDEDTREESEADEEQSTRRRRPRRRKRRSSQRPPDEGGESAVSTDMEDEADDDTGDDDAPGGRGKKTAHKQIPTWQEAVSVIVDKNLANRSRRGGGQRGGRGRGRKSSGRRRG